MTLRNRLVVTTCFCNPMFLRINLNRIEKIRAMGIEQYMQIELLLKHNDKLCKKDLPLRMQMNFRFIQNQCSVFFYDPILQKMLYDREGFYTRRQIANI